MAPPNPKRPPRPPRPPGTQAPKDSDVELPFDDDEVDPLRADDPRPQRVPQFPAGSRRARRQGGERVSNDRELAPRLFDWANEYSDPGHPPAFLYVERGPGVGQLVPVKQGPLVMGRSSSSDLRLQHPSISRRHAQLTRRADRFFLKDLSSQNGTFVNRNRVTAEVEVMPGDEISMGNALLRLRGPGGTPALGVPAITTTNTLPDGKPKKELGNLGVALIAAGLGSAVAALITVIAVGLGGNDSGAPPAPGMPANPPTPVTQLASMEPRPANADTGFQALGGVGQAPGVRIEVSPGPSAMDVAQGTAGAAASKPERSEPGPSAHDVASGGPRPRTGPVSPAEADVLKHYEAGDVSAARERARATKLKALHAQLERFESAEAESRGPRAKRDVSHAITQLTIAVELDEALASGRSQHGPQLRKRLADLHVQAGAAHDKAGRVNAARESYELALRYDADHREAREQLARLSPAAVP